MHENAVKFRQNEYFVTNIVHRQNEQIIANIVQTSTDPDLTKYNHQSVGSSLYQQLWEHSQPNWVIPNKKLHKH